MPNSGILLVDKPSNMTSHDLVNIARKVFQTKKVGHNGTLDPDATGVMVLCIGQATRLNEYLVTDEKRYRATLSFGEETDTQDHAGDVIKTCPLPKIDSAAFEKILSTFLGKQQQTPPLYSAIKKNGKPLYQYAREGLEVPEIPSREIEIFDIQCVSFSPEKAMIDVHCGKGTYIRTLCQDIARACGSCGHMFSLQRTAVGPYTLAQCHSVEELKTAEDPYRSLLPMSAALSFPCIEINDATLRSDLMNGKRIPMDGVYDTLHSTHLQAICQGRLLAIGHCENGQFVPKKVFHE